MNGTIAITMAGLGSRFAEAGFTRPKYELHALGRPLFDWAILSLTSFRDAGWNFHFAVREGLGAAEYISSRSEALGIGIPVMHRVDQITDGQATTALMIAMEAPQEAPFAVYNIDTFVAPGAMAPPDPTQIAGWVPCFPAPGDGWSFARTGPSGYVAELREKTRISNHATVGFYWFDSAARYVSAYANHYRTPGNEEKGERYVAPIYNQIIGDKQRVTITELALDEVGMLGTPEQVSEFIKKPPPAALPYVMSQSL